MEKSRTMKYKRTLSALWITLFILLALTRVAQAQTETPLPAPGTWKGQVSGTIVNRTPGGKLPQELALMLHAWDEQGNEKLMVDGKSAPDGSFQFKDVAFDPGLTYGVMLDYNGTSYFSSYTKVKKGDADLKLVIPIYETTTDTSTIKASNLHLLFSYDEQGLSVSQVYVLTNSGQKTVKDGVVLPSGRKAAIRLPLPENAKNVQFNGDDPTRFILLPDGFADTAGIVPGDQTSQIMLNYHLSFQEGMSFDYKATLPVEAVSLLVPQDTHLSLQGEGLASAGVQTIQSGRDFLAYTHDGLQSGDDLRISITGNSKLTSTSGSGVATAVTNLNSISPALGLGIGAGTLGLALVMAGVWWWRRTKNVDSEGEIELDELDESEQDQP